VCFGCEIHNCVEAILFEYLRGVRLIGNIPADVGVSGILGYRLYIAQFSRICQAFEINDFNIFSCTQNVPDKAGSDESRSTRNEDFHGHLKMEANG
jgi:hypothetical protein